MKQTKFAKALALCAGVLVFSAFASYMIFAWTAPSSTPPSNNADAPLNTGFTAQGKIGNLGIGITTPRAKLDINGTIYLTGGNVSNIPSTIGFQSSDAALLVPTYTGTENSDLRLYLEDNSNERFSIWGNSCGGGGCMNLDNSSLAHSFEAGGDAYHKGYVKGQAGLCIGNECRTAWPSGSGSASSCADGEWVIGIDADGQVICKSDGNTPWSTVACDQTSDDELSSANSKRIFVTSIGYNGYSSDTVTEVDNICKSHAEAAGFSGTYKAFVYLSGRVPFSVLPIGKSFWNCGVESGTATWHHIANSPTAFFTTDSSGNYLDNPIQYNEMGTLTDTTVRTNFIPNGSGGYTNKGICWNTSTCAGCAPSYHYLWGKSTDKDIGWAYDGQSPRFVTGTPSSVCYNPVRSIYCVQQ